MVGYCLKQILHLQGEFEPYTCTSLLAFNCYLHVIKSRTDT